MVHRRQDPINKVSLLDASGHTELDMKSDELVLPSSSAETTETSDSENGNEVEVKSNNHTEKHTSAEAIEVTDAPDWPSNLIDVEKDVGKTLTSRLFHWGPMLAFGLIFTVISSLTRPFRRSFQIGLTTTVVHFEFWSVTNPVAFINLSIFLYFNYGVMFNLIRASYVGGGYVTRGWHPSSNLSDARRLQYCAICESFKAPRSHHCKKCDRCVMKMDHHCPW